MITPEELLRLETVGVLRNGRRRYDPASKQRLVEACLQPGELAPVVWTAPRWI
ncbi:transposase-like protein [Bradyrhizobium japonicum]